MAQISFSQPVNMLSANVWYGYVTSATATRITINNYSGEVATYTGSFRYSADDLSGGTVTAYTQTLNYSPYYSISGLNLDALAVKRYLDSGNAMGLIHFAAAANDTFNGSSGADVIAGFGGNDIVRGNGGADVLYGGDGNDELHGGSGNDALVGDGGLDTAVYQGAAASYRITKTATGFTVSDLTANRDGTDSLALVERVQFSDGKVALDSSGNAGQAYRLYKAALNRSPDKTGLGFQMKALDDGASLLQIAQNFILSPEFSTRYGSLNNEQFVTQLYQNVLSRGPDTAGLSFHVGRLNSNVSRSEILVGFSESPENQAALVGVIQNGMSYS